MRTITNAYMYKCMHTDYITLHIYISTYTHTYIQYIYTNIYVYTYTQMSVNTIPDTYICMFIMQAVANSTYIYLLLVC